MCVIIKKSPQGGRYMFSIPQVFANEDESYITLPALRRFAKEKKQSDLKTTVDRAELIRDIEKFAQASPDNEEAVLEWLDQVVVEGIKDVQVKCINSESITELLFNDEFLKAKLETLLLPETKRHLNGQYTEELKLFRYRIVTSSPQGRSVKLYLGKLLCTFDKKSHTSSTILYPIFVEVYIDKALIVTRAKSKSGLFKYMKDFLLETADTTTVEKQIEESVKMVCGWLNITTLSSASSNPQFKKLLYSMLEKYTQTPTEIADLMTAKAGQIENVVNCIMSDICNLTPKHREDVSSSILNMIEKYFSISYSNKKIFTQERDAYPLKLAATDEEESKVEQTAAMEEPLQSKAIFFDNKKMLQKNQACDGVVFKFKRINPLYCSKWFKVKIIIKKDCCTLKFTEYTMEEDIINVLFSFIGTEGTAE